MEQRRDANWYREEAKRLRAKGERLKSHPLKQGYLDLADEFDRLADLLEKGQVPEQP